MAFSYLSDDPSDLAEVLQRDIPWETYMTARLITDKDLQLIRRYDKRAEDLQASLIDEVEHRQNPTISVLLLLKNVETYMIWVCCITRLTWIGSRL
jgi:hypothetical protein